MTVSAFIGFALVLAIVVVAAVVIAMAAIGKRRDSRPAKAADDEPTGYVPGVWLLGGEESAAPRGRYLGPDPYGHHHDAHGVDAGGAHGADAGTGDAGGGDAGGGDAGGGGDGGGAH